MQDAIAGKQIGLWSSWGISAVFDRKRTGPANLADPVCSKFKAIACLLLFVKSCLESSLLVFVAGLAEKSEHVLLVSFNAGLVERIYSEEVT